MVHATVTKQLTTQRFLFQTSTHPAAATIPLAYQGNRKGCSTGGSSRGSSQGLTISLRLGEGRL